MSADGKCLLGYAGRREADAHRCTLPYGSRTGRVRTSVLSDFSQRFLQDRTPPAQLSDDRVGLPAILSHSAIGRIVSIPARRRVVGIEIWQIDGRDPAIATIHQQPSPAL